ncbi:MAG: flotillin-like protein FloA [Acidobacteriota bacterium]
MEQILLLAFAVFAFLIIFFWLIPLRLFIAAFSSGAYVSLFNLIGMRFRRVPPNHVVEPRISAVKAGLDLSTEQLESHFLAGGNVFNVVNALISADKAGIKLSFQRAAAIDLAGRNVLEAVKMSVNPKVITTPVVAAVAKDGIQLKAISRVTVRANIDRLVGGAGEETIIARVGEGIVTTIGSADTYEQVLENPDMISRRVLEKGLDSGTAFEILSIDIADVDVGANVGAKLQIDQAEADKQVAQARAESRRAMAVAQEQEMRARTQEMRARLIEAEAQVPQAIAEAFRAGNLGVMDYYRLQNIEADTSMRESIAQPETRSQDDESNS